MSHYEKTEHTVLVRGLVQRVTNASVSSRSSPESEFEVVGSIGAGLCVLVGVTHADDETAADKLATKIWGLRIFDDADGAMNLAASDAGAEILVVSQFTLYGNTLKGRRPSWVDAARPEPERAPLTTDPPLHRSTTGPMSCSSSSPRSSTRCAPPRT